MIVIVLSSAIAFRSEMFQVIERVKNSWQSKAAVSTIDGVHIETDEWWVHLRKSNTEPIIRVIGEAKTEEKAVEICNSFMAEFTN